MKQHTLPTLPTHTQHSNLKVFLLSLICCFVNLTPRLQLTTHGHGNTRKHAPLRTNNKTNNNNNNNDNDDLNKQKSNTTFNQVNNDTQDLEAQDSKKAVLL